MTTTTAIPQPRPAPATRGRLTPRQREVYGAIVALTLANRGCGPTYRDLVRAMDFASTEAVAAHLRPLAKKGWVRFGGEDRRSRSIEAIGLWEAVQPHAARAAVELLTAADGHTDKGE